MSDGVAVLTDTDTEVDNTENVVMILLMMMTRTNLIVTMSKHEHTTTKISTFSLKMPLCLVPTTSTDYTRLPSNLKHSQLKINLTMSVESPSPK